jgi:hypothetical protein
MSTKGVHSVKTLRYQSLSFEVLFFCTTGQRLQRHSMQVDIKEFSSRGISSFGVIWRYCIPTRVPVARALIYQRQQPRGHFGDILFSESKVWCHDEKYSPMTRPVDSYKCKSRTHSAPKIKGKLRQPQRSNQELVIFMERSGRR